MVAKGETAIQGRRLDIPARSENGAAQGQNSFALRQKFSCCNLGRFFIEPGVMLHPPQLAVSVGSGRPHAGWHQASHFRAHQQGNIADVVDQIRMAAGL